MTKFFKNQPVRSDTSGMGVVHYVSYTSVGVQFGKCIRIFDLDGRRAKGHPIDLHPLEVGQPKFYVGQKVKDERYGNGEVIDTNCSWYDVYHPIGVQFENYMVSYRNDGSELTDIVRLSPIDHPKIVLSERQRKQLKRHETSTDRIALSMDVLESIISEPEPPKYQPKQGESVMCRHFIGSPWNIRVATGNNWDTYDGLSICDHWKYCRPFDP
ncbi:MAG TPA: hypothetical protein VGK46_13355, partial [Saprospiraceae bacterium]